MNVSVSMSEIIDLALVNLCVIEFVPDLIVVLFTFGQVTLIILNYACVSCIFIDRDYVYKNKGAQYNRLL